MKVRMIDGGERAIMECGCEGTFIFRDEKCKVIAGASCGNCIENMTFPELQKLMEEAVTKFFTIPDANDEDVEGADDYRPFRGW